MFTTTYPDFIESYKNADWEKIRLMAENLLVDMREDLEGCIEKTTTTALRSCTKGTCVTVQQGARCELWYDLIYKLDEKYSLSKDLDEKILPIFWLIHASAYERWEDSFDYNAIDCRLHFARQFLILAKNQFKEDEPQHWLIKFHEKLSIFIHHAVLIENSMVTNDALAMSYHTKQASVLSREAADCLEKIDDSVPWLNDYAALFLELMNSYYVYHNDLGELIDVIDLRQNRKELFQKVYVKKRADFFKVIDRLEEEGDYEYATEYRAHLMGLEGYKPYKDEPRLLLKHCEGTTSYGFHLNLHDLTPFNTSDVESNYDTPEKVLKKLKKYFEKKDVLFDFPCKIFSVSEDPPPDILDSSLGEEHFTNIQLTFEEMEIYNLRCEENTDRPILLKVTPKIMLYAIGVGLASFVYEDLDMSIPEFHALKNMASPHSGQYEIVWKDEAGNAHIWSRLMELAHEMVSSFLKSVYISISETEEVDAETITKYIEDIGNIDLEHSWFSNTSIYKIFDPGEKKIYNVKDLQNHWEWTGLISYQRADKATIDDWVNINPDALELNNLAGIRAHKDDLYILGENHSLIYLPDDPRFIVLQYLETAKWTFLIRILVNYILNESKATFDQLNESIERFYFELKQDGENLPRKSLKELLDRIQNDKVKVQRFEASALSAVDHVTAIGVSQYADHALLLRKSFESTHINFSVEALKDKLSNLKVIQESTAGLIEQINEIRQKKNQKFLNVFLIILSALQFVSIYELFFVHQSNADKNWFIGLLELTLVIAFIGSLFQIIASVRGKYLKSAEKGEHYLKILRKLIFKTKKKKKVATKPDSK